MVSSLSQHFDSLRVPGFLGDSFFSLDGFDAEL